MSAEIAKAPGKRGWFVRVRDGWQKLPIDPATPQYIAEAMASANLVGAGVVRTVPWIKLPIVKADSGGLR